VTSTGSIDDLGVRHERGRLGVVLGAEAEHGRRVLERLGEVRQRRDPDPAADEQRPRDVEAEAAPERPKTAISSPGRAPRARASRARSGRSETRARRGGARQSDIGRGSTRPGASSMKNCPASPGSSRRARRAAACTGPTARRDDATPLTTRHALLGSMPLLQRQRRPRRARSRSRATAARAPESVVMHGIRATSAASRIA
jgi:hypothetical protein